MRRFFFRGIEHAQHTVFAQHFRYFSSVPVTVLSGFLGAGKTTLMNDILAKKRHDHRIAVVVNDMAEINVDAELIRNSGSKTSSMVELENGCICCTLKDDLVIELSTLAQEGKIDHIVVESTGVSEPLPVAQTFSTPISELIDTMEQTNQGDADKRKQLVQATQGIEVLADVAHLHSLVTVVDCSTFLDHLNSLKNIAELGMSTMPGDTRPLAYLLAEQVQFANLLILNKTDLVSSKDALKIEKLLHLLNPSAQVVPTTNSQIDVAQLLSTRTYDEKDFNALPAWAEELAKTTEAKQTSEALEYGLDHFSIRVLGRPLHAGRWAKVMNTPELFQGILRAKGCFWTSVDPDTRIDYSLVGLTGNLIINTMWAQSGLDIFEKQGFGLKLRGTESDSEKNAAIVAAIYRLRKEVERLQADDLWHPITHDRRVEFVFIGDTSRMQQERLRQAVEGALLTRDELRTFFDVFTQTKKGPADLTNPFISVPRCVVV